MDEQGLSDRRQEVKRWYDGFTFGSKTDIYNPWSIINYLDKKQLGLYWANISSNSLVGKLIKEGTPDVKIIMEDLLKDKALHTIIDEQIVFGQLGNSDSAMWSLFLASGYLKAESYTFNESFGKGEYALKLTNREVRFMFEHMINGWFMDHTPYYNGFIKVMLAGNVKEMNQYMNKVSLATFSYFDTGKIHLKLQNLRNFIMVLCWD